ncbi:hypothetical protein T552_03136 [Pneumocystis carinii B80]|uniref:Ribosomal protein L22 n=1 Tax=Pneumocystis carinii (strain B80) TaxID=1408658 RepID=A0A0W4ZBR9_PNEC8|nr:hypothetical protein T552_03136 [Pneumocystis carinii B80]KTW25862.1 hypothetical protein T552_03136 [Pneumocystis carinii B80]
MTHYPLKSLLVHSSLNLPGFFSRYINNVQRHVLYKNKCCYLSTVSDIFDKILDKAPKTNKDMITYKSPCIKTSLKKLTKISRQIAGKKLEDAILQMDFSKKKAARDVAKMLRNARTRAINSKLDENTLFIDQSWVGKGIYIKQLWFRGRGRMSIRRRPRTHIKIIVKDITTLKQREIKEKKKKESKPVWVPLPNKQIYNKSIGFTC